MELVVFPVKFKRSEHQGTRYFSCQIQTLRTSRSLVFDLEFTAWDQLFERDCKNKTIIIITAYKNVLLKAIILKNS